MASVSAPHHEKCPYCASESVDLEWRDPIDAQKFQYLWHCENCNHEFTTVAASDEADPSMTEITQAFFTSLLVWPAARCLLFMMVVQLQAFLVRLPQNCRR